MAKCTFPLESLDSMILEIKEESQKLKILTSIYRSFIPSRSIQKQLLNKQAKGLYLNWLTNSLLLHKVKTLIHYIQKKIYY